MTILTYNRGWTPTLFFYAGDTMDFVKEHKGVCGIYGIQCGANGRMYVGSSTNIGYRIRNHFYQLKRNKHQNTELQFDFNLYGMDVFSCIVLDKIDENNLLFMEQIYITKFDTYNAVMAKSLIIPKMNEGQTLRFYQSFTINKQNGCWEWNRSLRNGYGRFWIGRQKCFAAHRVSYSFFYDIDISDLIVCHQCDNKKCVNPMHLFLGSHSMNHQDRVRKGIGNVKLNKNHIDAIRCKFCEDVTIDRHELAKWFYDNYHIKTHVVNIMSIATNKTWKDENYHPPIHLRPSKTFYMKRDSNGKNFIKKDKI